MEIDIDSRTTTHFGGDESRSGEDQLVHHFRAQFTLFRSAAVGIELGAPYESVLRESS